MNVFQWCWEYNLLISNQKTHLFTQDMMFGGSYIGREGIKPNIVKLKAVAKWPIPLNLLDLIRFLGLTGYFWSLIQDYAPTSFHQDNPLDSFLKNITKTQGCDQVLHILRSTFNTSLNKQENPLANEISTAEEWDESAKVLTVEATPHVSLPDHHTSF